MENEISFMAPNGCGPIKMLQEAEGGWSVIWSDRKDPDAEIDFVPDGPDDDWESVLFRTGKAQEYLSVWMDGVGERWLSRHLLPVTALPLERDAVTLARRDYAAAAALDRADRLVLDLAGCANGAPPTPKGKTGPTAKLIDQAERLRDVCREQSEQLARAFMAVLETERAAGRGLATEEGED